MHDSSTSTQQSRGKSFSQVVRGGDIFSDLTMSRQADRVSPLAEALSDYCLDFKRTLLRGVLNAISLRSGVVT